MENFPACSKGESFFIIDLICILQVSAAVFRVAGLDVLAGLHQPQEPRGAEGRGDGLQHLPHPALPRHQVRVGRLARVGGHPLHRTLQGKKPAVPHRQTPPSVDQEGNCDVTAISWNLIAC